MMLKALPRVSICLLMLVQAISFAEDAKKESGPGDSAKKPTGSVRLESTHKQSRVLTPKHEGAKIALNTFCLAPSGELLLCVGGPWVEYQAKADAPGGYEIKHHHTDAFVQKYSPEGELVAAFSLDFKPTGINMIPGGKEFVVAGEGWMARMTLTGEIVKKSRTPQVGDYEKFKAAALAQAKEEVKQNCKQFEDQLEQIEKTIAKLEETPEEKRTSKIKAQIKAQHEMAKQFKDQISQFEQMSASNDPDEAIRSRLTVTGVAVTDKDIFVSVRKLKGHGYEVWRTNHDFSDGEKVVSDLGGCCGQLDIQASADKLLVAENGKFRVGIYDRDGEMTKSFGKRDRKSGEGFGSCCNPMNVRCCENGDILTAESSIGDIKRFSADGKFLGYVGKAKIGGGCKHVAIEFDAVRNRYYMQHQDKGHICVLVPLAEITGPSEDELQEKAAREGLGQKLVGEWTLPGAKKPKAKGLGAVFGAVFGATDLDSQSPGNQLTFEQGGQLRAVGGQLAQFGSNSQLEWKPVLQKGDALDVAIVTDGVETYNFHIKFESDDAIKVELRYDESVMADGHLSTSDCCPQIRPRQRRCRFENADQLTVRSLSLLMSDLIVRGDGPLIPPLFSKESP